MFDVGEKVVCVDDKFPEWVQERYTDLPKLDVVYVIRDVVPAQNYDLTETCAVLLVGIMGDENKFGIENGFNPNRFRPLESIKMEKKAEREKLVEV